MKLMVSAYVIAVVGTIFWPVHSIDGCSPKMAVENSLTRSGMAETFNGKLDGRTLHSVWQDVQKNRWIVLQHKKNGTSCVVSSGKNKPK